jgi:hypothetical protein
MKIEDIKIGMKVRIREWDDMERERGLNGSGGVKGTVGFSREMRKFCGKCYTVANIDDYRIKLDKSFHNESRYHYSISADMLEPVVEEFTMPQPPDLGELDGVKLPSWMWDTRDNKLIYIQHVDNDGDVSYVYNGSFLCRFSRESKTFVAYTGQDLQQKYSVDELKRMARLV